LSFLIPAEGEAKSFYRHHFIPHDFAIPALLFSWFFRFRRLKDYQVFNDRVPMIGERIIA